MPVDYRLAGLDPWKKYDENRDYLLRRAMLDENIAARQSNDELSNRRLALGKQQLSLSEQGQALSVKRFEEQKAQNKFEQNRLSDEEKSKRAEQAQQAYMAQVKMQSNILAQSTPENYETLRNYVNGIMEKYIELGTGTDEEKAAAKARVQEFSPEQYDEKFIKDGLKKIFGGAEKEDVEPVYLISPDGKQVIDVRKKGAPYQPPANYKIVKDYAVQKDIDNDIDTLTKKANFNKAEAVAFRSEQINLLADFGGKKKGGMVLFMAGTDEPTEEYQNTMQDARKFYEENLDNVGSLSPMDLAKFKNATLAIANDAKYNAMKAEQIGVDFSKIADVKSPEQKQLTADIATEYLKKANGNRSEAEKMAKEDGFTW